MEVRRMNVIFSFAVIALIFGLCVQNGMAWRRRRRVWYGLHKKQIEKDTDAVQIPPTDRFCALHGEYKLTNGRMMPCDITGKVVDGLKCNKDLCWKGEYCWQCRLKTGTKRFQVVSLDRFTDIICEDVQCLYGNKDTGLEYYTTNSSRSIPLSRGPFTCSNYLCMSDNKCWKCRLIDEVQKFQVIGKGQEFNTRVSCCPIPKVLFSVTDTRGGHYKSGTSNSNGLAEGLGSELEFDDNLESNGDSELKKEPSVVIEFPAKKLVVAVVLKQKSNLSRFSVSFSDDGRKWSFYQEYNRIAVFQSTSFDGGKQRTLFKPLVTRYLQIKPFNDTLRSKISVSIYGCDISSNE